MPTSVPPNDPNYSLEKAGDWDTTGTWLIRINGERAGYVRPIIRGFGRTRQWEAVVDGVPVGPRMRARASPSHS